MDKIDNSFLSSPQDDLSVVVGVNSTPTVRTLLGFLKIDLKIGAVPILAVVEEYNADEVVVDDDSTPNDDAVVQVLGVNPVAYDSRNVVATAAIARQLTEGLWYDISVMVMV